MRKLTARERRCWRGEGGFETCLERMQEGSYALNYAGERRLSGRGGCARGGMETRSPLSTGGCFHSLGCAAVQLLGYFSPRPLLEP